jgi:uncharacterized protein Yka (UPF0111/DUF47 family)
MRIIPLRRGDKTLQQSEDIFAILMVGQHPFVRIDNDQFSQFVEAAQNSIHNILSSVNSLEQQKQRADELAKLNDAKV